MEHERRNRGGPSFLKDDTQNRISKEGSGHLRETSAEDDLGRGRKKAMGTCVRSHDSVCRPRPRSGSRFRATTEHLGTILRWLAILRWLNVLCVWAPAVERLWHLQDSHGQILALALGQKHLNPFTACHICSTADLKKTNVGNAHHS